VHKLSSDIRLGTMLVDVHTRYTSTSECISGMRLRHYVYGQHTWGRAGVPLERTHECAGRGFIRTLRPPLLVMTLVLLCITEEHNLYVVACVERSSSSYDETAKLLICLHWSSLKHSSLCIVIIILCLLSLNYILSTPLHLYQT